jgi:serine/threonine-protein kinase
VPPAVDAVVARAMEKAPERRFQSARAFGVALREAVAGARAAAPEVERTAVAVHAAARLDGEPEDDDALAALATAVDTAEQSLAAAGLAVPLRMGDSLLAVKALPGDPAAARRLRAEVLLLARSLPERMRQAARHPALRPQVTLHLGEVRVRSGPSGDEVVGGALLRTAEWVAEAPDGFHATAAALDGIG